MPDLRDLLFWAMFPLVLPQALWVRRSAPRFAPAAGDTEGTIGDGTSLRLIAVGDSIIAGVGASRMSSALVGQTARALARRLGCRIEWRAHGRSGARSATVLAELPPGPALCGADFILVSIGVNDVTSLTRRSTWRRNLSSLLDYVSREAPAAAVAVAGIPPLGEFPLLPQPLRFAFGVRGRAFDSVMRRTIAEFPGMLHVPVEVDSTPERFSADGFHPSETGYAEFGEAVTDRLLMIAGNKAPR